MNNTKTYLKIIVILTILLASSWLSGCGDLYIDGEPGWVVYEEYEVIETEYIPVYDRLVFKVVWDDDYYEDDLYTKLITPLGGVVIDDGIEIDYCFFLGTYSEYGNRKSIIECLDPFFGLFDVKVSNPNMWSMNFTLKIREEYNTGYDVYAEVHEFNETLYAYDQMIIPFMY